MRAEVVNENYALVSKWEWYWRANEEAEEPRAGRRKCRAWMRQPFLLCRRSGAFLVRKRVSARGGCIELQIARGHMDIRPWTNSLVATAKKHRETLEIFRSCRSRILVTSIPRHPWVLGSLDALSEERKKKKRRTNKCQGTGKIIS